MRCCPEKSRRRESSGTQWSADRSVIRVDTGVDVGSVSGKADRDDSS